MKLGIGLPGYLGGAVEPATVIEWARRADQAGFSNDQAETWSNPASAAAD